jgi:meiotic recombination protein SPO11
MDLDLLADFSTDHQASLTGTLLSNLPTRELTHQNATGDIFPPYAPTILDRATNLNVPDPNIAGAVITKIEDIIESIAESILDEKKEMVIRLKTRKKAGMQVHDSNTGTIENLQDDQMKSIRFPSKSPREAWKFSE